MWFIFYFHQVDSGTLHESTEDHRNFVTLSGFKIPIANGPPSGESFGFGSAPPGGGSGGEGSEVDAEMDTDDVELIVNNNSGPSK